MNSYVKINFFYAFTIVRNMQMVDHSNLIVCYIQHNSGGAYKTVRYAKNNGVEIYSLADDYITVF